MNCKDCNSTNMIGHGSYQRFVRDFRGSKSVITVKRYKCKKCGGTQNALPKGLLPYKRYHNEYYETILEARFCNFSTFRKISLSKILKVAKSTANSIVRWFVSRVKNFMEKQPKIRHIPTMIFFDDKFVKPNSTVTIARDRKGTFLNINAFPSRWPTEEQITEFLENLKSKISVRKDLIFMTDMWKSYAPAIKKVFPDARHVYCLLHVNKAINNAIKQTPKKYGNLEKLRSDLFNVFEANSRKGASRRLNKILKYHKWRYKGTKVEGILNRLDKERNKIFLCLDLDIPRTNNISEQGISLLTPLIKVAKLFPVFDRLKETLIYFEFSRKFKDFSLIF